LMIIVYFFFVLFCYQVFVVVSFCLFLVFLALLIYR